MQNSKPTIFDVAQLAGVSIKTVSRVVNNEPNVRESTKARVLAAVNELEYKPSSAARGLSGKRSWVIGLVYENPHEFSYLAALLNGILKACEQEGYSMLLHPLNLQDPGIEHRVRQFVTQTGADGIVLPPPVCDIAAIRNLLDVLSVPVALITPSSQDMAIAVHCQDEQASCQLTEHVIALGHERIGFIKGHPDHSVSAMRLAGYRRALKANGIARSPELVCQGYFDFESGQKAAAKLLALKRPPTAIIASSDDMAAGVHLEANRRGLEIPRDLSLAGFDDIPLASRIWPPLTTVRQPIDEMSSSATQLLIQQLKGAEDLTDPAPFDCEIVIRQSTGPLLAQKS